MAKQFIDFSFLGKRLSSLPSKYISVDFDTDDTIALGMEREMETGETNKYRLEPNYSFNSTEIIPYKFNDTINYDDLSCLIDCIDDTILLPDVEMHSIFELENIDWNEVNRKILITDFNKI